MQIIAYFFISLDDHRNEIILRDITLSIRNRIDRDRFKREKCDLEYVERYKFKGI